VVQCLALSRLWLYTLLSNRIKDFSGVEAKPDRRWVRAIRNRGFCGPVLRPIQPEVRYPFVESYQNFPGAEAKPKRRWLLAIRNRVFCGPVLRPIQPEVRYLFVGSD